MHEQHRDRCDPAYERGTCKQAQPRDLAIDRLPPELEPQRLLRPPSLLVDLRALQLQPRVIPIERLLQGGDDNIGEPRLDLAGKSLRGRGLRKRRFRRRDRGWSLEFACGVAKRDDGVVGPEQMYEIHPMDAFKRRSLRGTSTKHRETAAAQA